MSDAEVAAMFADLNDEQREKAVVLAAQVANELSKNQAFGDGEILKVLLQLFKELLPILLQLLKG